MKRRIKSLLLVFSVCIFCKVQAQTIKPDLQDTSKWRLYNRSVGIINEDGKKGVHLSEAANDGYMILKEFEFSNATLELDLKGKNIPQQSFVGIVFHGIDEKTYDAIYFRPFNFINPDTARQARSVQYISVPGYPWEKLRADFPGKYESKVNPVPNPDGWFHVKIIVDGKKVSTYVNDAAAPSLQVEKLTNVSKGGFALWVGNGSGGSFANLTISVKE